MKHQQHKYQTTRERIDQLFDTFLILLEEVCTALGMILIFTTPLWLPSLIKGFNP